MQLATSISYFIAYPKIYAIDYNSHIYSCFASNSITSFLCAQRGFLPAAAGSDDNGCLPRASAVQFNIYLSLIGLTGSSAF